MTQLYQSKIKSLPLVHQGKVRDIYAINDELLLIVTTDRLSAFDFILPTAIPNKGKILTEISNFWFNRFSKLIQNHLVDIPLSEVLTVPEELNSVVDRAIIVKRVKALPIEAIVRGYVIGSAWKDYQQSGKICDITLPSGLQLAEQLNTPIYTPSSKASVGEHDENISYSQSEKLLGEKIAQQVKDISITLYQQAAEYALERGIIIADTKFEFGLDENNQLILIDEILTPDSSRFWDKSSYQIGTSPQSFDKQYVRDYLESLVSQGLWDKKVTPPALTNDIVTNTQLKYQQAADNLIK